MSQPAREVSTQFRKVLRTQDLVLFGIICVTPTAPIPWFGILQRLSRGQAATAVVFAMFAMLPTAFSYGRMAARYPATGSAYTYVARGLHPQLGFVAGWATLLDYFLIPITGLIYCALTLHRIAPVIPYVVWAALLAALSTFLNLRGIRTGVRAQQLLLILMTAVIAVVVGLAVQYITKHYGGGGLFTMVPFYRPDTFDLSTIATATSLAALTYIGFDAVTALAEEVEEPRRSMVRATVGVCLITGLLSVLLMYLGQIVWPNYSDFKDADTAFLDVAQRIGGGALFVAMVVVLVFANFGAALTGQAGAARTLFAMGRSGAFPRRLFAHLNAKTRQPSFNVGVVGLAGFVGAICLDFERAGELLNFGAFLAFMGVNLASLRADMQGLRTRAKRSFISAIISLLGFLSCFAIWLNLPRPARRVGFAWMGIGMIYQLIRSRLFSRTLEFVG